VTHISAKQYKSSEGNDIWAYVILDKASPNPTEPAKGQHKSKDLKLLLDLYADVFQDHITSLHQGVMIMQLLCNQGQFQLTPDPIITHLNTKMRLRNRLNTYWKQVWLLITTAPLHLLFYLSRKKMAVGDSVLTIEN